MAEFVKKQEVDAKAAKLKQLNSFALLRGKCPHVEAKEEMKDWVKDPSFGDWVRAKTNHNYKDLNAGRLSRGEAWVCTRCYYEPEYNKPQELIYERRGVLRFEDKAQQAAAAAATAGGRRRKSKKVKTKNRKKNKKTQKKLKKKRLY